jgi:hypothetical protein
VDGKADGVLPAWHFTTQLDGASEMLLFARTESGIKAMRGNGSMEEEHNRAAKGQLIALRMRCCCQSSSKAVLRKRVPLPTGQALQ